MHRWTALFALAGCLRASAALADPADAKQACLDASEAAQKDRMDGKLGAARRELTVCARQECPAMVRQDCTAWMAEVLEATPTIVLGAKDPDGHDLVAVRVTMDGELLAASLDGRAIAVDPGVHDFRFESAGLLPREERVVVRAGQKNRGLTFTLASARAAEKPLPSVRAGGPPPVAAWVLGGVGVVALSGALYADLRATGDAHDLRARCAPLCATSDVDAVRAKYLLAAGLAGAGVVLFGIATYLFLSHKDDGPKVVLDVGPGGARGALVGRF